MIAIFVAFSGLSKEPCIVDSAPRHLPLYVAGSAGSLGAVRNSRPRPVCTHAFTILCSRVCVCAMYTYTCLIDCLIHVVLFFIWRIKYLEVALPLCATFCGKMEEPAAAWPEQFKLSKMWDSCEITRDQMRKQQRLLDWPGAKATGVATKVSLKLNRFVVRKTMQVWVDFSDGPKSPPIAWLRQEASQNKSPEPCKPYIHIYL